MISFVVWSVWETTAGALSAAETVFMRGMVLGELVGVCGAYMGWLALNCAKSLAEEKNN